MARDSGDDGLLDLGGEERPRLDEGLGIGLGEGEGGHLLDIGASGEGALGASKNDDGGVIRRIEFSKGLVQLLDERRA